MGHFSGGVRPSAPHAPANGYSARARSLTPEVLPDRRASDRSDTPRSLTGRVTPISAGSSDLSSTQAESVDSVIQGDLIQPAAVAKQIPLLADQLRLHRVSTGFLSRPRELNSLLNQSNLQVLSPEDEALVERARATLANQPQGLLNLDWSVSIYRLAPFLAQELANELLSEYKTSRSLSLLKDREGSTVLTGRSRGPFNHQMQERLLAIAHKNPDSSALEPPLREMLEAPFQLLRMGRNLENHAFGQLVQQLLNHEKSLARGVRDAQEVLEVCLLGEGKPEQRLGVFLESESLDAALFGAITHPNGVRGWLGKPKRESLNTLMRDERLSHIPLERKIAVVYENIIAPALIEPGARKAASLLEIESNFKKSAAVLEPYFEQRAWQRLCEYVHEKQLEWDDLLQD